MLHQVGAGTLGPVFRAHDPSEGRLVAIKAFRLDLTPERAAAFAAALNDTASRSLDHPSIASPITAGVEGTTPWLAQMYVPAESLDSAFRQYGRPPLADTLSLLTELAGALDFAAAAGVLHGALHPRDVLVAPDEAHLIDLGVAAALEAVGQRAPIRRPYAAPERVAGGAVSRAADIFSLGAHRESLIDTFAFALAVAPDERFTTALGFVAALKRALGDAPSRVAAAPRAAQAASVVPEPALGGEPLALAPAELPGTAPEAAGVLPDVLPPPDVLPSIDRPTPAASSPEAVPSDALPPARTRVPRHDRRSGRGARRQDPHSAPPPIDSDEQREASTEPPPPAPAPVSLDEVAFRVPAAVEYGHPDWEAETSAMDEAASASDARPARNPVANPSLRATGGRTLRLGPLAAVLVVGIVVGVAAGWLLFGRAGERRRADQPRGTPAAAEHREPPAAAPPPLSAAAPAAPSAAGGGPQVTSPGPAGGSSVADTSPRPPVPAATASQVGRPPAAAPTRATPQTTPRGRMVVRSTPPGARVEVNGRSRGQTPLTIGDLPLGAQTIRVIHPGYGTEQRRVTLTAGRPSQTLQVPLSRSVAPATSRATAAEGYFGRVSVETRPAGARVYIDGRAVGTSPLELPRVAAGSHVVRLELDRHRRWSASVQVVAGERTRVAASLEEEDVR